MLAVGWTCEIRVCIRVMRYGRLGTIDGADRLAILTLDACHIWNPDEVYRRYIPCIYHVYSERRYIPCISQVYIMDIEMLFSWIQVYGQVNAVIQSND